MIILVPEWNLGPVPTALDDEMFVYQLHAPPKGYGTVIVSDDTPIEIELSVLADNIETVTIGGIVQPDSAITRSARIITVVPVGLSNGAHDLELLGRPPSVVTKLVGELPEGIVLEQNALVGIPRRMEKTLYKVTFRATYMGHVRDTQVIINAYPSPHVVPIWADTAFPADPTVVEGISIIPIAELRRAQSFIDSFEMAVSDQYTKPVAIPASFDELPSDYYPGLPLGLTLDGATIKGTVSLEAIPGWYIFYMGFEGHGLINAVLCSFQVNEEISTEDNQFYDIEWLTPEGTVGVLETGEVSTIQIKARRGPEPAEMTIALGGLALPHGMSLALNGEVRGTAPYVNQPTIYRFRVKASSGGVYDERTFDLVVQNTKGILSKYGTSSLKLGAKTREEMLEEYVRIIPEQDIFRRVDRHFGIRQDLSIYVLNGFSPVSLIDVVRDPERKYERPIRLGVGPHVYKVINDKYGEPMCEFIYREINDFQDKAGGFLRSNSNVIEDRVRWVRPDRPSQWVYPVSIRNYRHDIVDHLGMASNRPQLFKVLGTQGPELPPPWLAGQSYFPALAVAYVEIGTAARIVRDLNAVFDNHTIDYFRYTSEIRDDTIVGITTFDGGRTTFDGGSGQAIRFDVNDNTVHETVPMYGWKGIN